MRTKEASVAQLNFCPSCNDYLCEIMAEEMRPKYYVSAECYSEEITELKENIKEIKSLQSSVSCNFCRTKRQGMESRLESVEMLEKSYNKIQERG